jgi:hypothetical protein
MGLIAPPEADRTAGAAGAPPDARALIEEARAHARRRRLKLAAALAVAVVLAVAGMLIARAVTGTRAVVQARPHAGAAAVTGIVTGHLAACYGVWMPNQPPPVTPGTVVVLRGILTWKQVGPGTWQIVYPKGPVVAEEHISNNYNQTFRFALPPGHYVLAGRYDEGTGFYTSSEVTVTAGRAVREDLRNVCK